MDNQVNITLTNCMDCISCYTEHIPTADSFEHESGAYCKLVEDRTIGTRFGQNGRHRLICSDDWNLRKYANIPDWCPLISDKTLKQKEDPKVVHEKALYFEYKTYLMKWMKDIQNKIVGESPFSFEEWKVHVGEC